ncbi:hypothetical protein SDC9_192757 [bioreactor metagenome]|uniref:Uncharacterized protein n=1 Tax=bioreactor metagenome TaxID=1076179 RepID=A0A645I206_9ZZZZ
MRIQLNLPLLYLPEVHIRLGESHLSGMKSRREKKYYFKHDLKGHEMKNIHKKKPIETRPETEMSQNEEQRV